MNQIPRSFWCSAFSLDGEFAGLVEQSRDRLSARWLATCESVLRDHGESLDFSWGAALSRFRTKCTAFQGAAITTWWCHGSVVQSGLLLSGVDPAADSDMRRMFLDSMRRNSLAQAAARIEGGRRFERLESLDQRPLYVVVPWLAEAISAQDREAAKELALHFASAFFLRAQRPGA